MSKRVTVRLSDAEVRLLDEAAGYLGSSRSHVLRAALRYLCLDEKPRVEKVYCVTDRNLEKLLAEFSRQGNNLNQIARHLNSGGVPAEIMGELQRALETLENSHKSVEDKATLIKSNMLAVIAE